MRPRFAHVAVLLSSLLLAACAALPPHQSLPPAARDGLTSTDVVEQVPQHEIYVFVPNSSAGAVAVGGILGALVDAGINDVRTSKAEAAVKPLRDALVGFDFDATLRASLKNSLSGLTWLNAGEPRLVKEATPDSMDGLLAGSKAAAVLFAMADYRLDNDGRELTVALYTTMFPNSDALRAFIKGKPKPKPLTAIENTIYRNNLSYVTMLPGATDDRDKNIAQWSADNGAAMRSALTAGSAKLAEILAYDLQQPETPAPATETEKRFGAKYDVVRRDADGRLLRLNGTLVYLTNAVGP